MKVPRILLALLSASLGLVLGSVVVVIGAPFWAVAGLARLIWHALARSVARPLVWQQVIQFEPTLGWKAVPKVDAKVWGETGSVFHLTTDEDGWRGRHRLADSDVVVFGDSFAFGHSVDDRAFFANLSEAPRIKSIGVNGYNMVQEFLWMERLSADLAGKLVVWFIFYANDLYDNLAPNHGHYRMPFVSTPNGSRHWRIVTSHIRQEPWSASSRPEAGRALAEICSVTPLSARVWDACHSLIARGRDVCDQAGARLAIMGIPSIRLLSPKGRAQLVALAPHPETCDPDLPDRRIAEICSRLDLPFVPLSQHLRFADYVGTHWNTQGNRRVAAVIANLWDRLSSAAAADAEARDRVAESALRSGAQDGKEDQG